MVTDRLTRARAVAEAVEDPELPPLTVADLGILRDTRLVDGIIEIALTPTYSGCPAMREITVAVKQAVEAAGAGPVKIRHQLTPGWTTDWLTETARTKRLALGIAPPVPGQGPETLFSGNAQTCPRCASRETERIAGFGSTACKALHRCLACREPFEAFKCH